MPYLTCGNCATCAWVLRSWQICIGFLLFDIWPKYEKSCKFYLHILIKSWICSLQMKYAPWLYAALVHPCIIRIDSTRSWCHLTSWLRHGHLLRARAAIFSIKIDRCAEITSSHSPTDLRKSMKQGTAAFTGRNYKRPFSTWKVFEAPNSGCSCAANRSSCLWGVCIQRKP